MGGQKYGFNRGLTTEYRRWLNHRNQAIGSYTFVNKTYNRSALERYEGNLHGVSLTLVHFYSPTLIFMGGADIQKDMLESKDESSDKYGIRAGVIKEWKNSISTRVNVRVAKRTFKDPHFLMQKIREDNEYQLDLSVWHRKIHWKGITPKINYRYLKIDSNIRELYGRDSHQYFVSLEKTF